MKLDGIETALFDLKHNVSSRRCNPSKSQKGNKRGKVFVFVAHGVYFVFHCVVFALQFLPRFSGFSGELVRCVVCNVSSNVH